MVSSVLLLLLLLPVGGNTRCFIVSFAVTNHCTFYLSDPALCIPDEKDGCRYEISFETVHCPLYSCVSFFSLMKLLRKCDSGRI